MIHAADSNAELRFLDQQAQIAQVVAGGAGDDGVAERGEHGTGVEGGQRRFEVEAEGVGAGNGGGVGDGAGRLGVAVDAVGAGAEHGEMLALVYCSSSSAQAMANCWLRPPAPGCGPW
jgi:hypothetical protein